MIKDSAPEVFIDPELANPSQHRRRVREPQEPQSQTNPARLVREMHEQMMSLPGAADFVIGCAAMQALSANWEDNGSPPRKVVPNGKPIGLAQWGAAMSTATLVTAAIPGLSLPSPGADPLGFIWLHWCIGPDQFSLELHANLLHQSYKWQRVLDGAPQTYEAVHLDAVIGALRQFYRSAKAKAQ